MTDERQLKEIAYCLLYLRFFFHGTDGHNAKAIIGTQAVQQGYEVKVSSTGFELTRHGKTLLILGELPSWNPI